MLTEPEALRHAAPHAAITCCLCGARLRRTVLNLGPSPIALGTRAEGEPDHVHNLQIRVCDSCLLVQTQDPVAADCHPPPPSAVEQEHGHRLAQSLRMRLGLNETSLVVEIGDNRPSLLAWFRQDGIPGLSETMSFNAATAMDIAVRSGRADVVLADNVLQLVPDLFDFAAGFAALLRPKGIVVIQVPHLLPIIQRAQFDAFRHDHRCYLSMAMIEQLLRSVGLRVFDSERLADRGGTLRIYACHPRAPHTARPALKAIRAAEASAGLHVPASYDGFAARVTVAREDIRDFLATRAAAGRRVAGYGVATLGTSMLSMCQVDQTHVVWIADPDGAHVGRFLPGCGIPVVSIDALTEDRPSDLLILPWPRAPELVAELLTLRQKGTQFWVLSPVIRRV